MKRKKLFLLFASTCLILALAVSPFMAACAAPVEPGAAEIAALQKEVAALEKEVAAAEKKASTSEKEVASLKGKVATAEKEIAKLEAAAPEPAEVFEFTFSSWASRGVWAGDEYFPYFCNNVETMSGGQIKIEFQGCGEVYGYGEQYEAMKTGALSMGAPYTPLAVGIIPEAWLVGGIPFSLPNVADQITLHEVKGWNEIWSEVHAAHNIKYLLGGEYWLGAKLATKEPLESLDDLEGLKVRATGSYAKLLEALGASITMMPKAEAYMAVATGVIDGIATGGFSDMEEHKFHEVCPYIIGNPISDMMNSHFLMNMDDWNSLTEDLQHIVLGAVKTQAVFAISTLWGERNQEAWLKMEAEGAELIWLSEPDVAKARKAGKEIMMEEIAPLSPAAAEMLDILWDYMRELGYME